MKIGFITDTNILTKKQGEDKSKLYDQEKFLDYMDFFINYIDDLNSMKQTEELTYLMLETILEELSCQKVEAFNEKYKFLSDKYKCMKYGLKGELPKNNIQEAVKKEKKYYLTKVTIIKLKYQSKIYRELVKKALNKLPPFDKSQEKRKSDAGFKDALIWKTIVHSEEIDNYNLIYYFSGDSIFEKNQEYLIKEFEKKHPNTKLKIRFINPNEEKLQNCLKVIIDENNFPETDCIKLYNKTYIMEFIRKLKYDVKEEIKIKNIVYDEKEICLRDINFKNFNMEDFKIEEVEKIDNKFVVNIKFVTKKYVVVPKEAILTEKRNVMGSIKLEFSKNKKVFVLENKEVTQIKFGETLQETLQRLSNIVSNLFINDSDKIMIDTLNNVIKPLKETYANAFKYNFSTLFQIPYLEESSEDNEPKDDDEKDVSKEEK